MKPHQEKEEKIICRECEKYNQLRPGSVHIITAVNCKLKPSDAFSPTPDSIEEVVEKWHKQAEDLKRRKIPKMSKDTLEQVKFTLDRSIPLEDVSHTEIEKFPEEDNLKTKRITYTIYLN